MPADTIISYPFWVLIPGLVDEPAPNPECGYGDLPLAFSAADKMLPYLSARKAGDWRMRLVTRDTLFLLISELNHGANRGICLDVEPDGSGGTEIPLSDLMKVT
jgi:hypothetical protein